MKPGMKWVLRIGVGAAAVMAVAGVAVLAAAAVYVIRVTDDLPDYAQLADYEPAITSRVHAGDGTLIAEYAHEHRAFVPVDSMPPLVVDAFISAEDKNFYRHNGLDYIGILRAGLNYVDYKFFGGSSLQGASTITQQVAKNFLLSNDRTFDRKIREMVLARKIERTFSKARILELYLNEIYLGNRSYGVAAAALNYFGKPLDELTLAEAAYLAALPKAPNNYDPVDDREEAIGRRNWVVDRMRANGYVERAEAQQAQSADLVVTNVRFGVQAPEAEYFAEEVRRALIAMAGEQALYDGGLSVRTSLDMELQRAGRAALRDGMIAYDRRHGWRGAFAQIETGEGWQERLAAAQTLPDLDWVPAVVLSDSDGEAQLGFLDGSTGSLTNEGVEWTGRSVANAVEEGDVVYVSPAEAAGQFELQQVPEVSGAFMAMDPHTGRVLALVGGFSFQHSQFNRASQALRQPGSSFKPVVYAAAMENGMTPSTILQDTPITLYAGAGQPLYRPQNYSNEFLGPMTVRRALALSQNIPAIRAGLQIGVDRVADYAERLGVADTVSQNAAMLLGTQETTLWRMMGAYSTLANGGRKVEPSVIDRVQDRYGQTIYTHDPRICEGCEASEWTGQPEPDLTDPREQVVDPIAAYQVTSMLQGVVERGTATRLRDVGKTLAGKTGTTDNEVDAWFIGYSPDLVAGAYIGFDQPRDMGTNETGGRTAAPIVRDFLIETLAETPDVPFRVPPGARLVPVNPSTGERMAFGAPGSILEAFRPGAEPGRARYTTQTTSFRVPGADDFAAAAPPRPAGAASMIAPAAGATSAPAPATPPTEPAPASNQALNGIY
jgi:penicillin-binding protein 1A